MAIQSLKTIRSWFRTGLKPTQLQFWDTWDSFRHKSEKIPAKDIEGIDTLFGDKIIPSGQFLIFKVDPNTADELEIGDSVIGYCENNFLCEATYYGGDTSLMSSFSKANNSVGRIISFNPNDQYYGELITYELNDEVLLRSLSCGVYNGIYIVYKRPGESDFSRGWFNGTYPKTSITWLDLPSGTIIKLIDTIGGLDDSEEFIISK
ncbi:hypothetical protein C8C83_3358 [Flavobacterium sp. 90]|uniref:hypothetical protein n=1 Tax=unclassified Flavobacterium TaxID=196869 RepID=UPI000EB2AB10|nr:MULTISPECIES: hypothetical protein [unclassified Flavobacterium]RKR11618.1 hypothetical protein C8C82_3669 [Flavobacterium sp. 81]TCK55399.1 hypothetical protein C8C83_3358 [Flavobacterium sp. 90]